MDDTHPAVTGLDRAVRTAHYVGLSLGMETAARLVDKPASPIRVFLEPGDATRYDITMTPLQTVVAYEAISNGSISAPDVIERRVWMVAVNGLSHEWPATISLADGYAAQKWGAGNSWTGAVIASFLSSFADGLDSDGIDR